MEYIDGEDLRSLRRRIGRLPHDRVVEIGAEIAGGLAAVHEQGILHRDLKPANLMIDGRGRARITDFGIAGLGEVDPWRRGGSRHAGLHGTGAARRRARVCAQRPVHLRPGALRDPERPASVRRLDREADDTAGAAVESSLTTDLDPALERVIRYCLEPDPEESPGIGRGSGGCADGDREPAIRLPSYRGKSIGELVPIPRSLAAACTASSRGLKALAVAVFLLVLGDRRLDGRDLAATARGWRSPPVGELELPAEPALPDEPSIVVLPFANLSGDPEQEAFSDGLSEDVMTDLASIPDLFIIARGSAFSYKGRTVPVQTVGRELGVRYVVEGSVQRSRDQLRVTARLSDAATGFEIWRQRYDRPLAELLTLQSEISETLLGALHVGIEEAEVQRIRHAPSNLSAYEAFVRARTGYTMGSCSAAGIVPATCTPSTRAASVA